MLSGLVLLLAVSNAQAAVIRGAVQGWDGPALAGARATLANADTSVVLEARSAADGGYRFEGISTGSWHIGASHLGYAYRETLQVVGAVEVVQDFSLGPDVHPGRWTTIGNTDPENLYATNSASLLPDGRIFYCHDTLEPALFNPTNGAKSFPAVRTVTGGFQEAGEHRESWNLAGERGARVGAGVYFVRRSVAGERPRTQRVTVVHSIWKGRMRGRARMSARAN